MAINQRFAIFKKNYRLQHILYKLDIMPNNKQIKSSLSMKTSGCKMPFLYWVIIDASRRPRWAWHIKNKGLLQSLMY